MHPTCGARRWYKPPSACNNSQDKDYAEHHEPQDYAGLMRWGTDSWVENKAASISRQKSREGSDVSEVEAVTRACVPIKVTHPSNEILIEFQFIHCADLLDRSLYACMWELYGGCQPGFT